MGERGKRMSLWDTEDDTNQSSGMREHNSWRGKDHLSSHGSGRFHDFSDSRTNISRKSRDPSGWPAWDSLEEHPIESMNSSFKNMPEEKELDGGKRYHKNVSPRFDKVELRNYDHTHEYDRSHPQRYMVRGISRSRSRSRARRSQSRSLSRERVRVRVRGWSRSRSRSRSDENDNDRRSSPIRDYRRQPYGLSDERGSPEMSSKTCSHFISGRCRRGNLCRFIHPNFTSHRDDDFMEDDRVESWRSRVDHIQISNHSYTRSGFESRSDVSHPRHREDEHFLNKSSSVPCKDFIKGNCRWGENCRFSHHAAPADSFGQGSRNSFDHQQHKSRKPLCKYFAAGRCNKDNCWFSHEDPNLNNLEGRISEITDSRRSHDKSSFWNAAKRDDEMRILDTLKPSGHNKTIVSNTTSIGNTVNRQNDDKWEPWEDDLENESRRWGIQESPSSSLHREKLHSIPEGNGSYAGDTDNRGTDVRWKPWDHDFGNKKKKWGIQEHTSDSFNSEKQRSLLGRSGSYAGDPGMRQNDDNWQPWGHNLGNEGKKSWDLPERTSDPLHSEKQSSLPGACHNYGGDRAPSESTAEDNIAKGQEDLISHGSHKQNHDALPNLHHVLQENQSFSAMALQQNVHPVSHNQHQLRRVIESNSTNSLGSDVPDEVKDVTFTNQPILSGRSFNQNGISIFPGNSSVSIGVDRGQGTQCLKPSKGIGADLNGPDTSIVNALIAQTLSQNNPKVVQPLELIESKVSQVLTNFLNSKLSGQVTNCLAATTDQHTSPETNPVSLTQMAVNEQPQMHSALDVSNSKGMLTNLLTSRHSNQVMNCPVAITGQHVSPVTNSVSLTQTIVYDQSQMFAGLGVSSSKGIPTDLLTSKYSGQATICPVATAGQHISPEINSVSLPQMVVNEQPQHAGLGVPNSKGMLPSFSSTSGSIPPLNSVDVQPNPGAAPLDLTISVGNSREMTDHDNHHSSHGTNLHNQMLKRSSPSVVLGTEFDGSKAKPPGSLNQQGEVIANLGVTGGSKATGVESNSIQKNKPSEILDGHVKHDEGSANKDEKALRVFKNALVELVKEILKPTWKEGRMSRDVYKTVVKKVVDKVSSTIQADHMPKTQDQAEHYLSYSKPKITKLVQTYVERSKKADA